MKIITSSSSLQNSKDAVSEIAVNIKSGIEMPHLLLAYYSETQDVECIKSELKKHFPSAHILGCSSCKGTMTDKGYVEGHNLSVWAAQDYNGAYGTAVCEIKKDDSEESIQQQAQDVLRRAIDSSGRPGELPALITLHTTTGYEESVLRAIRCELGTTIPIIGGTAADDNIAGNWSLFDGETTTTNGIAMAVFFPSARVSYSFHSGYAATEKSAIVTRVRGRTLLELDGKPAGDVYSSWYKEATGEDLKPETLFANSTLYPLGRQSGKIHDMPYYTLSHPANFSVDGGIEMFCNFEEGERAYFMIGTTDMLVSRAGRVVNSANEHDKHETVPIGGIAIYCAGCMLHVKEAIHEVAKNMRASMQDAPFICPFTLGEQGQFLGGEITHGNLMISAALFHQDE